MLTTFATAMLLAAKLEFVVPDANFSVREGLPAVQVLSLYQDRYGALWVGTPAGLAHLGGPTIKTFGPEEGLSRSAIFAIAEEPSGALVVGTASGISRLVGRRFESVTLPAVAAELTIRRFVHSRDGTLWALAGDRTLLRYSGDHWLAVGIDGALAFEATDFAVDDTGVLWLATRGHGLLRLARVGTRFQKSAGFQATPQAQTAIDHVAVAPGKVYFTSSAGLSVLSTAAGGVVETARFPAGAAVGDRALAVTHSGGVFAASGAGVFALEGSTLVPVESRNDRARHSAVTLLSDREGQLWIGTTERGLNLLLMGRGVRFLRAGRENFRSIDVDKGGVHWVSNERRVLAFRTDEQGNPISIREAQFEGFDDFVTHGIAEDPDGGLLFAMGGGVGLLSKASRGSSTPVVRRDPRFEILRDRLVAAIHTDSSGAIWAVSPLGLYRLRRDAAEAQSVPFPIGKPWMAAMDSRGFLWVTTPQGAMAVIDALTEEVAPVRLPPGRHVEFVGPAPDGGVVAAFENGESAFFSLDASKEVSYRPGFPNIRWLSVRSLQKMGDSYLAAHGGDRLSQIRIGPERAEQTILTSADLEDSDFRYLSIREGRPGQLWFTLLTGIGLLDPPNAPPPPSPLHVEPARESFVLGPRPNTLDLHVELSDPVAPRKARYRYRLLGQSDQWSEWSGDPHIPLSNVAPGSYRIEVEAQDRYGRLASPLLLEVNAQAHLWESWPARVVALLMVMGLGYAANQQRVRAIEKERIELAAAVKAGRADLMVANQRLQELSLTDMLTGLRNRRYFAEVVEDEMQLLKRRYDERAASGDPNRDGMYFLLDLDRFKMVNDLFGHAGGDTVLKEAARRLQGLLRKTDRLIRWGGEEFLILSLDFQRGEASEMATRIMDAVSREPYPVGPPGGIWVTTSIGWAAYPFSTDGTAGIGDVVRLADRALYRAKRSGRNRAVGIMPASGGALSDFAETGPVEFLRDLGFSVTFTMVKGPPRGDGQDLSSLRESGSIPRPV